MLCEKCKMREASILYTEIINGVKSNHYFCTQCIQDTDLSTGIPGSEFPLQKLLSNLLSQALGEEKKAEYSQILCPNCKTSYEDFVNESKFGCPDCYEVFDLLIHENIKSLQGSDVHKGKHPKFHYTVVSDTIQQDLQQDLQEGAPAYEKTEMLVSLKKRLKKAVQEEDFETAAELRDEIKKLKEED